MALKTITEPQIKRVAFMEDVILEHVSVVDHGANWTPFEFIQQKIAKSDQGVVMPGQFIQAILTPESKDLEELAADPRHAWLRDLVVNVKRDYGSLRKYQCAKRESFDSVALAPIGDSGAYALVGTTNKDGANSADLAQITKAPADLIAAMQMPQEEIIARLIDDELYRFSSILWATMHQESQVPTKRKAIIMNALSGLWDFMNSILDALGTGAVKRQKGEENGKNIGDKTMTEAEIMAVVTKAFDEKSAELMARIDATKMSKDADKPAPVSDVVKAVTDLAAIVTGLEGKLNDKIQSLSDKIQTVEKKSDEVVAKPDKKSDDATELIAQLKSQVDALTAQVDSFNHSSTATPPPEDGVATNKVQADPGDWSLSMFKRI